MYLTHIAGRARQGLACGRCASRKNCRCCAITCCGSTATAAMTVSMASWMTASSKRYAEKCANDGTTIIAFFRERRGSRRGGTASAGPVPGFAAGDRVQRRGVGASAGCRQHPVPQADHGSARQGLQEPADHDRRAEPGDAGARQQVRRASDVPPRRIHRHHRSDEQQSQPNLRRPGSRQPVDAARTVANFNRAYWKMLLRMYGWGRAA